MSRQAEGRGQRAAIRLPQMATEERNEQEQVVEQARVCVRVRVPLLRVTPPHRLGRAGVYRYYIPPTIPSEIWL